MQKKQTANSRGKIIKSVTSLFYGMGIETLFIGILSTLINEEWRVITGTLLFNPQWTVIAGSVAYGILSIAFFLSFFEHLAVRRKVRSHGR